MFAVYFVLSTLAAPTPMARPDIKTPVRMTCGAPRELVQGSGTVRVCKVGGAS